MTTMDTLRAVVEQELPQGPIDLGLIPSGSASDMAP